MYCSRMDKVVHLCDWKSNVYIKGEVRQYYNKTCVVKADRPKKMMW